MNTNSCITNPITYPNIKLLTDDEFYNIVKYCIMCQLLCSKNELQSYLGTCYNCHISDIASITDSDDDDDDDDDDNQQYTRQPS